MISPFELWDCPGAEACKKERRNPDAEGDRLVPCASCKAPRNVVLTDGTIVYRSYSDYVG